MPIIRSVREADAARLREIYRYYIEQTAVTFEWEVPSVEEFKERIATISQRYPYLVLEDEGQVVGYAYASTFKGRKAYDWSVEMSIYIDRNARQKGYGRLLYQALEEQCRNCGLVTMFSCIAVPKEEDDPYLDWTSVEFHQKCGFTFCGSFESCAYKFDRWYDMVWMRKPIQDPSVPAPELSAPDRNVFQTVSFIQK